MKIMKKIKKRIKRIQKKIYKKFPIIRNTGYKIGGIGKKINKNTIIFSCFNGEHYNDSPKQIYEYLLSHDKYKNYKFIWVFKNKKNHLKLNENRNTEVIEKRSKKYRKYLHTAKYWVFNFKIEDYIKPTKDQILIQCWHGTPLKKMGCDLEKYDNALNTLEGIQKKYRIEAEKMSYFISPSKYASERFSSAWNLKAINKENILLEKGYPRNDFLFNYTEDDIAKMKRKIFGYYYLEYEKQIKKKKIILYAPTWRPDQYERGVGYTQECMLDIEKLQKSLGEDYIILFRVHSNIASKFDFKKYDGFIYDVSSIMDINEIYVISDILVTDYSSVLFDYANLQRPMIFFMYDLEHYRDDGNGFYIDIEKELPGKIVKTNEELEKEILRISNEFKYDEKYKKFNEKYNYLDDGDATKRVVEEIFK